MAIEGIVPALLTAFGDDGKISERELRRLVRHEVDAGAGGFFVCGSAGEGVYMTPAERRQLVEIVVNEVAGQVPIIAQVGAMSTDEAVLLAREARAAGAAAVSSLPPLLFRLPWPAIIEHMRAIAEAAELPTYYYHLPIITNVNATAEEFAEMADKVPGLVGFKYSSPDLFLLWGALDRPKRKMEILYGCDQQLYQGLLTGAHGGIGSTYNYQMRYVVEVYKAFKLGDHTAAMAWQGKVNAVIEVVFKHGGSRAVEKAMTSLLGFNVGPPRRPNLPLPEAQLAELRRDMEKVGLL